MPSRDDKETAGTLFDVFPVTNFNLTNFTTAAPDPHEERYDKMLARVEKLEAEASALIPFCGTELPVICSRVLRAGEVCYLPAGVLGCGPVVVAYERGAVLSALHEAALKRAAWC